LSLVVVVVVDQHQKEEHTIEREVGSVILEHNFELFAVGIVRHTVVVVVVHWREFGRKFVAAVVLQEVSEHILAVVAVAHNPEVVPAEATAGVEDCC
jgi:hypothetical protein